MKPTMKQVKNWLQAGIKSGDSQRLTVCDFLSDIITNCQVYDNESDEDTIEHMVGCAGEIIREAQAFIDTFGPEPTPTHCKKCGFAFEDCTCGLSEPV